MLSSDPLGLRRARRWLVRRVLEAGYAPQEAQGLGVAFSEACANVHRHAYGGRRDGRVELRVIVDDEQVVVVLDHDGEPFNPAGYVPPDLRRPSESGYGLYLIRALVDEVSFESTGSGGRVVMVKRKRNAEVRT
jgi:anti-sigma regulatory factor (Ser/Thr protein kinase)